MSGAADPPRPPRLPGLEPAVAALVEHVVSSLAEPDPHLLTTTAAAMHGRLGMMPRFLGLPMAAATLAFDWSGVAVGGRPFRRLDPEARRRLVAAWRRAPVGFCRDFLDFYEKMASFLYFSLEEEAAAVAGPAHDKAGGM